jgi:hypothetical protein
MFSNAQNLSIWDTAINNAGRDLAIHNAGRDLTIINNYIYHQPEPVLALFMCHIFGMTSMDCPSLLQTNGPMCIR